MRRSMWSVLAVVAACGGAKPEPATPDDSNEGGKSAGTVLVAGLWAWWFPQLRRARYLDGRA